MGEIGNVLQALDAWRRDGLVLAEKIEAERDTVRHRIDQDHAYMVTLNERLRDVRAQLGLAEDAAPKDTRGRIVPMTREAQRAVPVEHTAPTASAVPTSKTGAAIAALRVGPKTSAEVGAIVGVAPATASALLSVLRGKGDVGSTPIAGTRALLWWLTPKGAAR
jgi:hypothetical protein